MDPVSDWWRICFILSVATIACHFISALLLNPLLLFFAGCPLCDVKRQKGVYKIVRLLCQIVTFAAFVLLCGVICTFAIGVENKLTKGEIYLDYSMLCGDPKPFQPDECSFGGGFRLTIIATALQFVLCLLSLGDILVDMRPIRKARERTNSIWDNLDRDDPKVKFLVETYQRMQQRVSRMSVAFAGRSVRRHSSCEEEDEQQEQVDIFGVRRTTTTTTIPQTTTDLDDSPI